MPPTLDDDLNFATRLARSAARVALRHYGHVERLTKSHAAAHQEAVTQADRDVQAHILESLNARYPADGVVGEEDDAGAGITARIPDPMGRVWVIDPIDGTNNFIGGFGHFAVCIGLMERGMPVLGVVHDVVGNVTYAGAKGCGVTANGRAVRCLSTPLGDASMLMLTSNLLRPDGSLPPFAARWIGQTTWKIRMIGSAALEAALVAAGIAHGAVTMNGKLWDVAAAAALVLEAGGHIVTLTGQNVFPFDLRNYTGAKVPFLAAAPHARDALVAEVRR